MSSGRVLVVEDEVLIRMLAVDMLLDLGREADEAGTAKEALELLRAPGADYAFALLDLGLPDKRGEDLVRDIRETHKELPLIVASGEDQAEVAARLSGFAPIRFLGKPFDLDGLKAVIDRLAAA
ncbi:response regulator [Pseudorhodoplanes sp.]|uniref:response regulator n=1 Tax=Pseudorhodoplanes sp. TaxID=1934341 RepID=UPI00391BCBB5